MDFTSVAVGIGTGGIGAFLALRWVGLVGWVIEREGLDEDVPDRLDRARSAVHLYGSFEAFWLQRVTMLSAILLGGWCLAGVLGAIAYLVETRSSDFIAIIAACLFVMTMVVTVGGFDRTVQTGRDMRRIDELEVLQRRDWKRAPR